MRVTPAQVLIPMLITLWLSGCVIAVNTEDWEDGDWHSRQEKNARKIARLELGKSESSVREELGKPDFTESFLREGDTYLVLFYRTRHVESDGVTTKDETTPLVFAGDRLVGWGENAVEHAIR